ncbi:hypothetical protein Q1695_015224 [Nippostrongylus brasiliensis]|nr:hypothetical protein Q1695_015224 [Nippostrongylus brasiliensis]
MQVNIFRRTASPTVPVDFSSNPCPVVLGCTCIGQDITNVECFGIGANSVSQLLQQYPSLYSLRIAKWKEDSLNLDLFSDFKSLAKLAVTGSEMNSVTLSVLFPSISHLFLDDNLFNDWEQICNVTRNLPSLVGLSLNNNQLSYLTKCVEDLSVSKLGLRRNSIAEINCTLSDNIRVIDLSWNSLRSSEGINGGFQSLNISYNPLVETDFPDFVSLEWLDLSGTKFNVAPRIKAPLLRELVMDRSKIEMIDFRLWTLPNLRRLSMIDSHNLIFVSGELPEMIEDFIVTGSKLAAFPQSFFIGSALKYLNVSESNFDCDSCVMQWSVPVTSLITNQTKCPSVAPQANCSLGISQHDPEIVRAEMGKSVILPCTAYGTPEPTVEWWLFRPATYLGVFDPRSATPLNSTSSCCSVLGGGALLLHNVNRSTVERYVCVVRQNKASVQRIVHFRLDYASWYSLDLFSSVFWGGIATAILACSFSFLLNITWILTRKSILWWINRAERLSRVRKMVEAMEKYRTRQMEGLQAKYARRMQLVRENYHAQVEQLRLSYSSQAEKFRDYRAAQMEQMSSHLENIRENYNQQMQRVREYGSRRAEQLWESYERQVNRMKAFSLQHRLKMMRQYKVKQRYLNKLLESLQDSTANPEVIRQQEEEVRAALEMPAPPVSPTDPLPLSRSSSFYSLPEYIIDNDGILRPSPIIGRFSSNLRSNDIGNRRSTGASSHNGVEMGSKKSADEPGSSGL